MKKTITLRYIKTFNPCASGWKNLLKHYPDFSDTVGNFLRLEHVSYNDKIWLVRRVVKKEILRQWAVECAENVLSIYEDRYPGDLRVRECIEATKLYLEGKISREQLMEKRRAAAAAYAAAADAYAADAYAADAADAAAAAAAAAAVAAYAAADAAADAADAADAAAAAYAAADARLEQQDINLSILIALVENDYSEAQ